MRVHSFLDKMVRDWSGKRVLVVTHQVPYVLFRALFEHRDEKEVLELGDVPNCGIHEYTSDWVPEGLMKRVTYNFITYKTEKERLRV